jgi:hypothetical protein
MLVTCSLKNDNEAMQIQPFPGGQKARQMGCRCPYQPIPNCTVVFDSECKVHELEKVLKQ